LQYHDELVQPQAEIDFEQLVAFLLDRGAVPSVDGFADLRGSGLWTPAGTKLLLSPRTTDAVLSVATSEDSDGILSLTLEWREEWCRRGVEDLPPYWMRLRAPGEKRPLGFEMLDEGGEEKRTAPELPPEPKRTSKDPFLQVLEQNPADEKRASIGSRTSAFSRSSVFSHVPEHFNTSNIRLRIGGSGVEDIIYEDSPKRKFRARHLRAHNEHNSAAQWFSSAATALGAPLGGLWSYAVPDEIIALSKLDSVPCGVLVLMGLAADADVPAWRPLYDDDLERVERQQKVVERGRHMMEESRLPVAERQAAVLKRMQTEMQQQQFDNQKKRVEAERRKAAEMVEALGSQRLGIGRVAAAARNWLLGKGLASEEEESADIVERLLWEMIRSLDVTAAVARMLDAWKNWADNGGMTKAQFEYVKGEQLAFAYAACVLCLIRETEGSMSGSVVSDLQDCLRMWRRVRLG
jgi:hypothetical protein